MEDEGNYEEEEWQSGPFCRHWSDPADCETCRAGCAHCGCDGSAHWYGAPYLCENCADCPGWEDKD